MRVHKLTIVETLQQLGVPGLIGCAALVGALALALFGLWPATQELDAVQARAADARTRLTRIERGVERAPASSAQQLASFYGALPGQVDATEWIDRIYAAAAAEGLPLAKGEYSLTADTAGRLTRYQIVLPVQGDYLKIRRFVRRVLETIPSVGLEDFSLRRQTIADGEVEARLRMTLYMTKP